MTMGIPPRTVSTTKTSTQENNTQHVKITRKQLFLLFYTTDNSRGDDIMYFSAKTRRFNIEKASWFDKDIHLVFSIPIQDIAEIITTVSSSINKRGGVGKVEVKEISIFHMHGMTDLLAQLLVPLIQSVKSKWLYLDGQQ